MKNVLLKSFFIAVLTIVVNFGHSFSDEQKAQATGIPVFDAADAISDALSYIEWLFQHSQMLTDYAQTLEEWQQVLNEWEYALEAIQSISEVFGDDFLDELLKKHQSTWGKTSVADIIQLLDPHSESFVDATIEMMVEEMGVSIADESQRSQYLEAVNEENREQVELKLIANEKRDASFRDSLVAAANVRVKNEEREKQLDELKAKLKELGPNSEIATAQLNIASNIILADQQQDMLEVLGRMYAEAGKNGIYQNADKARALQRSLEIDKNQFDAKKKGGTFAKFSTSLIQ